jgi:RNA polymerase sigma factor (sigma-70 family)
LPLIHTNPLEETGLPTPVSRSDEQLVQDCLNGKQEAWSQLIDKYKNLIFSVPVKYGFSRDDAADIFQEVCLGLLSELKNVRDPKALPKWLLMVTSHKCFHWKRRGNRFVDMEPEAFELAAGAIPPEALELVVEAEKEQELREALSAIPSRCRQLIRMLFFDQPPRPYRDVAQSLGIATGSIGFIRQRCLDRLRKKVEDLQIP